MAETTSKTESVETSSQSSDQGATDSSSSKPLKMRIVLNMIRAKFVQAVQMSTSELQALMGSGRPYVLLDNRAEEEYNVSKIRGALWVDPDAENLTDRLKNILENTPEDATVVCYCSVGYRSSKVAEILVKNPEFKDRSVYNLEGSLFQWANEDRLIVDSNNEPTTLVHPYSFVWGRLLNPEKRFSKPS